MNESFCIAPWTNMHIHPTGTIRPCCISQLRFANIRKGETLKDAWNSELAQSLREEFLNGQKPKSCQSCYAKEAVGIESMRMQLNERFEEESKMALNKNPETALARQLDISFTNECNLACKICGPQCSTKWISLAKSIEAEGKDPQLWQWYKDPSWERFELSAESLIQQLEEFTGIANFEIKGGEPFISKQHDRFLSLLSSKDQAKNFVFRYVSNGTVFSEESAAALAKLGRKFLWISVDGVGDLFKYIRGGKIGLERLEGHLRAYAKIPETQLGIVFTLSIYNIFGIADFWNWYQVMRQEIPDLDLFLGMVRDPVHLNVTSFPQALREQALARMPEGDHPVLQTIRKTLSGSSEQPVAPETLERFRNYTRILDRHFNTAFENLQPEFTELLREPKQMAMNATANTI